MTPMNARWSEQPEAWEDERRPRRRGSWTLWCFGCDAYLSQRAIARWCAHASLPGYLCNCHGLWFEPDGTALEVVPMSDRMDSCCVYVSTPKGRAIALRTRWHEASSDLTPHAPEDTLRIERMFAAPWVRREP